MLFNSNSFHWMTVLTCMHSKTSLQKPYQAKLKVPFSNENNAEGKMNASIKEKECYVSNSCWSRENQIQMSGEGQGQVEKQLIR